MMQTWVDKSLSWLPLMAEQGGDKTGLRAGAQTSISKDMATKCESPTEFRQLG